MVFQNSFMIESTSLFHRGNSTKSSLRAMKFSKLLAPPKVTFRISSPPLKIADCQFLIRYFAIHDTLCHVSEIKSAHLKLGREGCRTCAQIVCLQLFCS